MPPETHARLSASSSKRWMHCPKSVALCERLPNEESKYAEEGHLAHAFAEKLLTLYKERGRRDFAPVETKSVTVPDPTPEEPNRTAEAKVDQEMRNAIAFYVEQVAETLEGLRLKDPDADILIEQRINYDHWVPGGFGTSDCVIISQGACHVFDLKYGKGVQVDGRGNSQLRLYALGVYEELNAIYEIESFETHIVQPRLNWVSGETLTKEELLGWGDGVRPLAKLADEDGGEFAPGPWCSEGFCPARDMCKARVLRIIAEMREAVETSETGLTPDLMGEAAMTLFAKNAGTLQKVANDVSSRLLGDILEGKPHGGWKAVSGRSSSGWDDPDKLKRQLQDKGYRLMDVCEPQDLLSPNQLKAVLKKEDYVAIALPHKTSIPGKPQLADSDDPREDYKPASAQEDFKDLIKKEGE